MKNWLNDAFFYHIYPFGFCGVEEYNQFGAEPMHRLGKISLWLDHMNGLGVNALYLGPVFESTSHGYDTADYYHIDRRLGTDRDFKELCGKIKSKGMRIILDGVFHHSGRDFWAFRDVREKKWDSPYKDWFSGIRFHENSPYNDGFHYDPWEGHYNLVKLNLHNPGIKQHLFDAVRWWIQEFDIDGLRLDVAYLLDKRFLEELAQICTSVKPDFILLGEVIHGNYNNFLGPKLCKSVTNYEGFKSLYSAHNDKNLFEIAYSLDRQYGPYGLYKQFPLYNFVDNHDVNRIASLMNEPAYVHTVQVLLFTIPGIPSVYYGSEWGIRGSKNGSGDKDLRPSMEVILESVRDSSVEKTVKTMAGLRTSYPSLRYGDFTLLYKAGEQMAFKREWNNEKIIVVLNISEEPALVSFPFLQKGYFTDLLNNDESVPVLNNSVTLRVHSRWAGIFLFHSS